MESKPIVNDLHLLVLFHTAFLFPHFKFLQLGNKASGDQPSFQARHLLVRYCMMATDLEDIKKKWKEHENFRMFVSTLNDLSINEQNQQKRKLTKFLRYSCESLKKHFQQWTSNNFFLGLFSNHHTARQVANVALGRNGVGMITYLDASHDRVIDCSIFFDFLKKHVTETTIMDLRNLPFFNHNLPAIVAIVNGGDIWTSNPS